MWEVYKTGWGLADWTEVDHVWEGVDNINFHNCKFLQLAAIDYIEYLDSLLPNFQEAVMVNLYALSLRRYDRWAVTPDDLCLANCATIIKRAYRRASNDPSYRMCRARKMPPPEEFHALCSAV